MPRWRRHLIVQAAVPARLQVRMPPTETDRKCVSTGAVQGCRIDPLFESGSFQAHCGSTEPPLAMKNSLPAA
jgi:hypothetical protein